MTSETPDEIEEILRGSFTSKHPWCEPYKVAPADWHWDLAMEVLDGIADILGGETKKIEFLRIVTRNGRLKTYFALKQKDKGYDARSVWAALNDFLSGVEDRSESVVAPNVVSESLVITDVAPVSEEKETVSASVEVLAPSSVKTLDALIVGADRETAERLKSLAKKLKLEQPWRKELVKVSGAATLDALKVDRFPNFGEFFEFLRDQFELAMVGDGVFRLPPTLLLGEPGIGKTEILLRLSEVLKTGFMVQNLAAAQSGSTLAGSEIFWSNSRRGALFDLLVFGKTANPVVMLDELDKVTADQFSPVGALYGLLERRTAARFVDLSLPGIPIDASHVVWFAAANDKRSIEPALLSRFRVFDIPAPNKEQMPAVVRSIYSDLRGRESWGNAFSPELAGDVLDVLVGIAPRHARMIMEAACAKAAADGRRELLPHDIAVEQKGMRIGF